MSTELNRKQRRELAKKNGVPFEPQYNGATPISLDEYKGVNKSQEDEEREQ